ncbi:Reverse transcriptase zinc-binding domain [Thalictrum thalictroides]|uniref:Reverse transcriptase zinc-binding domain n=1 Tax=Thalictrum thalictroides TaxID=46969 RepID=A0A7J6X9U6_THATH|nr:Reverse transcriptase zinc-binding domain [Thalictrum thalictroides]
MQTQLFHISDCDSIDRLSRRFWWSSNSDRKVPLLSWDSICKKKSVGGLGFKKSHLQNIALLSKIYWRILISPNEFWVETLKQKYFRNVSFLNSKASTSSSKFWKNLIKVKNRVSQNFCLRVGRGNSICIWTDPWVPDLPYRRPVGPPPHGAPFLVSDLINNVTFSWNHDLLCSLFQPVEVDAILRVNLSRSLLTDNWVWLPEKNGRFTVRSAYNCLSAENVLQTQTQVSNKSLWSTIWKLRVPHRIKLFAWKCIRNCLPTKSNLHFRNITKNDLCPMCLMHSETLSHCLFTCPLISPIWFASNLGIRFMGWDTTYSCLDIVNHFQNKTDFSDFLASLSSIAYFIWMHRNNVVFNHINPNPSFQHVLISAQRSILHHKTSEILDANTIPPCPALPNHVKHSLYLLITDGSYDEQKQIGGCGFLFGKYSQLPIFAGSNQHSSASDEEAEGIAILQGLNCATSEGVENVLVFCDCQVWVNALQYTTNDLSWELLGRLQDIKTLNFMAEAAAASQNQAGGPVEGTVQFMEPIMGTRKG